MDDTYNNNVNTCNNETKRFDQVAETWDQTSSHVERARELANQLVLIIKKYNLKRAIDYGSGTGLVSFHLVDALDHITLMDLSSGMLAQAQEKITKQKISNVMETLQSDLTKEPFPKNRRTVDLIYSLLTLHHVHDTRAILQAFYDTLRPGGVVCLADLDKEDGSFHEAIPDFDGHNGFDQEALKLLLQDVGFVTVSSWNFFRLQKQQASSGTTKDYPLFLLFGQKPPE